MASDLPAPSVQASVEQAGPQVGNSDASLSVLWPGNGAGAGHVRDGRADWFDSGCRPHAGRGGGLPWHRSWCSNDGRDRSGCRSAQPCGNRRTGSVFREGPLAVRANGVSAGDVCVMTYFVRNVVPGRRGLRGATADLTWRLGPVSRLRFHRPVRFLPYRHPICRASLARRRLLRNPSAGCPAGSKP